ncbi:MAG: DUF5655 domain-containing protein [Bacteroidia bacterium]
MALFNIDPNGKLNHVKEHDFKLEKEIQTLTEENLNSIFGFEFVRSEFKLKNFRIDTLAYDPNNGAFVIIEYKRDKNFSVIDQGYAYLSLMLNNKADIILEYNENLKKTLKRDDIDWSQSKVFFISPSFTAYQREAINFKDLPIELWEVKRYTNKSINYSKIQTAGAQESVKTISRQDDTIEKVSQEIKIYSEQEHLLSGTDEIKELYEKFKIAFLNLGDLSIQPKKKYIAFVGDTNVVDVQIQKNALKFHINLKKGKLEDPKKITRDVSKLGHYGNGDYELQVSNDDDLEYISSLVKQSKKKNSK